MVLSLKPPCFFWQQTSPAATLCGSFLGFSHGNPGRSPVSLMPGLRFPRVDTLSSVASVRSVGGISEGLPWTAAPNQPNHSLVDETWWNVTVKFDKRSQRCFIIISSHSQLNHNINPDHAFGGCAFFFRGWDDWTPLSAISPGCLMHNPWHHCMARLGHCSVRVATGPWTLEPTATGSHWRPRRVGLRVAIQKHWTCPSLAGKPLKSKNHQKPMITYKSIVTNLVHHHLIDESGFL